MQNSAAILENRLFTDSEILKSLSSYNICDQAEENLDNVMAAFNGEQDIAIEESVMRGASHYASPECNDYFHSMNIFNHDKYNLALLINLRILEQLPSDKLGDVFKDSFNLNDNYELTLESTSSKNYPKGSKNYPEGSKGVIKGLFLNRNTANTKEASYISNFLEFQAEDGSGRKNNLYLMMTETTRSKDSEHKSGFDLSIIWESNGKYKGFVKSYETEKRDEGTFFFGGLIKQQILDNHLFRCLDNLTSPKIKEIVEELRLGDGTKLEPYDPILVKQVA